MSRGGRLDSHTVTDDVWAWVQALMKSQSVALDTMKGREDRAIQS